MLASVLCGSLCIALRVPADALADPQATASSTGTTGLASTGVTETTTSASPDSTTQTADTTAGSTDTDAPGTSTSTATTGIGDTPSSSTTGGPLQWDDSDYDDAPNPEDGCGEDDDDPGCLDSEDNNNDNFCQITTRTKHRALLAFVLIAWARPRRRPGGQRQ